MNKCLVYSSLFLPVCPPPPQSLAELSTLQGLEEDHSFQKEVSLKTLVYKAYRSALHVFHQRWSFAVIEYY